MESKDPMKKEVKKLKRKIDSVITYLGKINEKNPRIEMYDRISDLDNQIALTELDILSLMKLFLGYERNGLSTDELKHDRLMLEYLRESKQRLLDQKQRFVELMKSF